MKKYVFDEYSDKMGYGDTRQKSSSKSKTEIYSKMIFG